MDQIVPDQKRGEPHPNESTSNPRSIGRSSLSRESTGSKPDMGVDTKAARASLNNDGKRSGSSSPRSAKDNDNPLMIQDGRSYVFWDTEEWKAKAERMHRDHELAQMQPLTTIETQPDGSHLAVRPPLDRGETAVSQLSDERSGTSEYSDAPEDGEKCGKCGNAEFAKGRIGGVDCLYCTKCGGQA